MEFLSLSKYAVLFGVEEVECDDLVSKGLQLVDFRVRSTGIAFDESDAVTGTENDDEDDDDEDDDEDEEEDDPNDAMVCIASYLE